VVLRGVIVLNGMLATSHKCHYVGVRVVCHIAKFILRWCQLINLNA